MSNTLTQTTPEPVKVKEIEVTRYAVECPNCSEWHEHDESYVRQPAFTCVCGIEIKVVS